MHRVIAFVLLASAARSAFISFFTSIVRLVFAVCPDLLLQLDQNCFFTSVFFFFPTLISNSTDAHLTHNRLARDSIAYARQLVDGVMSEDNPECPLCLEVARLLSLICYSCPERSYVVTRFHCCDIHIQELDATERNFKPCKCGYQLCLWCWQDVKEKLNGKCPACRSEYDESAFRFTAPDKKSLESAKKKKSSRRGEPEVRKIVYLYQLVM